MDTWQPRNFVEPSQALRKPRLALLWRETVFLGRLRAELATARSSPGLLLQCSPKFVLPVSILQQIVRPHLPALIVKDIAIYKQFDIKKEEVTPSTKTGANSTSSTIKIAKNLQKFNC